MSLHGTSNEPQPQQKLGNLAPGDLATNELKPMPWIAGEAAVSLIWVGQVYDQFTQDAPEEATAKK